MTETDRQRCELCGRVVPRRLITLHHLTPREKGGKAEDRVPMCRVCHKQLHAMFGNADLAKRFGTIEALRAEPELQTFLGWIRKQKPDRNFRTVASNEHPRSKQMRLEMRRRARRRG